MAQDSDQTSRPDVPLTGHDDSEGDVLNSDTPDPADETAGTAATQRIDEVPENDATSAEQAPGRTDTGSSGLAALFGSRDESQTGSKRRWGRSTATADDPTKSSAVVGQPRIPRLNTGRVAGIDSRIVAAVIGGTVGLVLSLVTLGMLRSCEAIRGVSSCGGSGGFVLLMVLLVAAIYLGALGMTLFKMPEPVSTSFLAMGTLSVLAMVFFLGSITSWWMFLVVPVLTAGCYAFWHWLTAWVIEPAKDNLPD